MQNFNLDKWRRNSKQIAYRGIYAKFNQNATLKGVLFETGDRLLVESSTDSFWGTGLHLHDRNVMKKEHWPNKEGGVICEILGRVCHDLHCKKD